MMHWYDRYKVCVPEGQSGDWKVSRVTVSKKDEEIDRLRAMCNPHRPFRFCPAGDYTKLSCNRMIVMSDTPDEIRDHMSMIEAAKDNILITGLGLGMVLQACLNKDEVAHATVIEQPTDVISLVGKHYQQMFGDRLTIINADAMTWTPPKDIRYGAVWHDIWNEINGDNIEEMRILRKRYQKISDWQGMWCYHLVKKENRKRSRSAWRPTTRN